MPILKETVFGGPEVGVYFALNNHYFIHPPTITPRIIEFVKTIHPDMRAIETFIAGSAVVGSFIAMNNKGMVVPSIIHDDELEILRQNLDKNFPITTIESENNAFGNLILCNDFGAIISPKLEKLKDIIQTALQVPVKVMEFANSELAGSCGIANNHGVIVHPMITENEAIIISEVLKVDIDVSTINCGQPYLGGGVIANDYGAVFGRKTTGPEIQRIMEILELE